MGNRIYFLKKDVQLDEQQLRELGETASKERDALLKERPELRAFQKEIDWRLKCAGSFENRMAVLGIMMEANLKELQKQLKHLFNVTSNLPTAF
ncbi:MAG: hypothetical protein JRI77_06920 [Deltaproteobacteria bacterium]|nr:hypothetical protein [Deltaproteobacteria bacterium]